MSTFFLKSHRKVNYTHPQDHWAQLVGNLTNKHNGSLTEGSRNPIMCGLYKHNFSHSLLRIFSTVSLFIASH